MEVPSGNEDLVHFGDVHKLGVVYKLLNMYLREKFISCTNFLLNTIINKTVTHKHPQVNLFAVNLADIFKCLTHVLTTHLINNLL